MKIYSAAEATDHVTEMVEAIAGDGLVCIPVRGTYRIVADARSQAAITRLDQSKRRAHNRPALVLVSDLKAARDVVDGTDWPITQRLAKKFWPGHLTLCLPPSSKLAPKVKKLLTRSTKTIGVRVSADPLVKAILKAFGQPVIVSSANLEKKPGANSAAAVRQRFSNTVAIWVDAGDLGSEPPSTLVEVTSDAWKIVREGAVTEDAIATALA
jgi:L-threonylcarbamoyladenylate synthase